MPNANDVKGWETHRGREYEFDETEAGTATISLKNADGKYDPTNLSSPYAGKLLALKQSKINVQHPVTGEYVDVFTGYVNLWNPRRDRLFPQRVPVGCSLIDGFSILQRAKVTEDPDGGRYYEVQHVDDRILAALGDAGWPAARTNVFTGNVNCQAETYDGEQSILDVISDAADAEFPGVSNRFCKANGDFAFHGRYARFRPDRTEYGIRRWHVGDASGIADDPTRVPIYDMSWSEDDEHIFNYALVTPQGIADLSLAGQVVKDQASIDQYGLRSIPIPALLLESGATTGYTALQECRLFAKYYVENYSQPRVRIDELIIRPDLIDPASTIGQKLWDLVLKAEIGDIMHVYTSHPGGGGFDGTEFFVEGIHHIVDKQTVTYGRIPRWETRFDLSPRSYYPEDGFPTDPD